MVTNRLACGRPSCHSHHVFRSTSRFLMRNLLAACLARISLQTAMKSLIAPVLLVLLGCAPDEVVLAKIADSEITEVELEQFVARLPKHLRSDVHITFGTNDDDGVERGGHWSSGSGLVGGTWLGQGDYFLEPINPSINWPEVSTSGQSESWGRIKAQF